MRIERKVNFYLNKRKGAGEKIPVLMRVVLRGQSPLDFYTRIAVRPEDWDVKRQRFVGDAPEGRGLNLLIEEWRTACEDIFNRYELIMKQQLTREEFRRVFYDEIGRPSPYLERSRQEERRRDSLFYVFDKFTASEGEKQTWTDDTYEKFHSLRSLLKQFDPDLRMSQMHEQTMIQYMRFLVDRGMRNTTIQKNLAFVRWFLRWAAQRGFYDGNQHETFHPKLKGTSYETKTIVYLEAQELQRIENAVIPQSKRYLDHCRDVFVFCCYSGLRYSDAAKLRRSDITNDHIYVVTQKTSETLRVELNSHTRAILKKHEGEDYPNDLALPVMSNQKMNDYLKELGEMCRIVAPVRFVYFVGSKRHEKVVPKWQVLTTHCARRTFVVIGLQLGIPAEVIMKWTGHATYESMKPYIAIADELKRRSMAKFDEI